MIIKKNKLMFSLINESLSFSPFFLSFSNFLWNSVTVNRFLIYMLVSLEACV